MKHYIEVKISLYLSSSWYCFEVVSARKILENMWVPLNRLKLNYMTGKVLELLIFFSNSSNKLLEFWILMLNYSNRYQRSAIENYKILFVSSKYNVTNTHILQSIVHKNTRKTLVRSFIISTYNLQKCTMEISFR